MKVSVAYPPLSSDKGTPLLSQNRQFQWFTNPTYIYPMVPAYAASLMASRGHTVTFDDGIADEMTYEAFKRDLVAKAPDVIAMETKTPVVTRHWKIVADLKAALPGATIVLMGDHVTALPRETMENCPVDYVIRGGDFDFILADLVDHLDGRPVALPAGVWRRENGEIVDGGLGNLTHNLDELPYIDRELIKWKRYAFKNGNFKYTPGAYVMAGRDCWWGRCTFCSWTTLFPGATYRTVSPARHVAEIERLVNDYGIREIFDDSGCFPRGAWLEEFCNLLIAKGLHKKVVMGCNMRVGELTQAQWNLLKKANFRFILIGLESMSQDTLNRLKKGIKVSQIEETVRMAKKAGLEPHITTMVGYPWETREDARRTVDFAKSLFSRGLLNTLQATIVVPYPGTPLFEEAKANGWLTTENWDDYDMRDSVWKSPISSSDVLQFKDELYKAALTPAFIIRKILSIRDLDDIKFLARAASKLVGHLLNKSRAKSCGCK
ncbi:B12-binding domain-containing radical SAM protein [Solidesulfovibrio carbinolicus]|uniref:B12-binding domain-containing radical SAM protein n=1 Tax=Solidesulfovibrio carbinolicus TaxID=296842 RepID=A0A4P6HGX7_9BACT|nr:radical SAM protein [Solidesulfovibrio carbinolicus]QAZ66371.1 B12-binding domain-containing radical SAM protein [Solidesulfovibrio carbinolicus]